MCGICGQFNYATGRPVDRDDLVAAASKLAHRGPDDEGYFLSGSVGLGFRRLSIIDLAGGHQPMSDREESVWVVFNGEVYNFPDLRAELQGKGHVFRTRSDTEVIVHGYKEWGDLFLDRIRGMFALAVWDVARRRLLVARDAMGIKPIYYRVDRESVFFASEIRALSGGAHCRPEVDAASLNLFLRYRYTPSPRTLFKGVRKLAPGAMMIVQDGAIRIERWYQFVPRPFDSSIGLEEAARELLE
jgi:asparagine synthase (glutamine-hydrolysing)